jgi:leucyl-tRNA synthetase
MLAPSTPHLAEELWQQTGREYSIHQQSWPEWDEALAKDEEVTLVVQVNGKLRDRITVPASINEEQAKQEAMASEKVKIHLAGKTIVKEIYVPGKLVNIVVR